MIIIFDLRLYLIYFRPNTYYRVTFGDELEFPMCTCYDWKKYLVPCKHMLAICKNIDGESFNSIGSRYLTSPHLTLDLEEIGLVINGKSVFFFL